MTIAADTESELKALVNGRYPDSRGRFGPFGGRFVPESLMPAITCVEQHAHAAFAEVIGAAVSQAAAAETKKDPAYQAAKAAEETKNLDCYYASKAAEGDGAP